MLKPTELRLGNHILGITGEIEIVCGIHEKTVKTRHGESRKVYTAEYDDVSGLPITPELLIEKGFYTENDYKHRLAPIYFCEIRGKWICFIHNCSHGHIIYWHQLENIFYDLTGIEL